mmetsp:Transcript_100480/g.203616  ORF Transcript_100480/g.203616 Transcript_100480/m.203616 type:complete len:276 (-) Transcript_100480:57-884(-)
MLSVAGPQHEFRVVEARREAQVLPEKHQDVDMTSFMPSLHQLMLPCKAPCTPDKAIRLAQAAAAIRETCTLVREQAAVPRRSAEVPSPAPKAIPMTDSAAARPAAPVALSDSPPVALRDRVLAQLPTPARSRLTDADEEGYQLSPRAPTHGHPRSGRSEEEKPRSPSLLDSLLLPVPPRMPHLGALQLDASPAAALVVEEEPEDEFEEEPEADNSEVRALLRTVSLRPRFRCGNGGPGTGPRGPAPPCEETSLAAVASHSFWRDTRTSLSGKVRL